MLIQIKSQKLNFRNCWNTRAVENKILSKYYLFNLIDPKYHIYSRNYNLAIRIHSRGFNSIEEYQKITKIVNDQNYQKSINSIPKDKLCLLLATKSESEFYSKLTDNVINIINKHIGIKNFGNIGFLFETDPERNPIIVKKFSIKSIPTLQHLHYGKLVNELCGIQTDSILDKFIQNAVSYINNEESGLIRRFQRCVKENDLESQHKLLEKVEHPNVDPKLKEYFLFYKVKHELENGELMNVDLIRELIDELKSYEGYKNLVNSSSEFCSILSCAYVVLLDIEPNLTIKEIEEYLKTEPSDNNSARLDKDHSDTFLDDSHETELRNLHILASVKYFKEGCYEISVKHAIEAYKIDIKRGTLILHLNSERSFMVTRFLLQSIFQGLGHSHHVVQKARAEIELLTPHKVYKIKWSHPRSARGGKPRLLRGKSGKWMWLGPDWKPPWAPRKWSNWDGPDDWYWKMNRKP